MSTSTTIVVPSVSMTSTASPTGTSSPSINGELYVSHFAIYPFPFLYLLKLGCCR